MDASELAPGTKVRLTDTGRQMLLDGGVSSADILDTYTVDKFQPVFGWYIMAEKLDNPDAPYVILFLNEFKVIG